MTLLPAKLTHQHARQIIRLSWLICVPTILVGTLWLFAPEPEQPGLSDLVQASTRSFQSDDLLFASYSELTSTRKTPFEFQELVVAKVRTREREPEPEPEPQQVFTPVVPLTPPPPTPDTDELLLVGTAPGGAGAFAMLQDQRSGLTTTVGRNDQIRNAIVEEIFQNKIVLRLGEQRSELFLIAIRGSETLKQQMNAGPSRARETGQAFQLGGQATRVPTTPASVPMMVNNSLSADANSQSGAVASTEVPTQQTVAANYSTSSAKTQKRSLGLSGHMLGLSQQQQLGLEKAGLVVTSVRANSSIIFVGDVVLTIGGKSFNNLADVKSIINNLAGDTTDLQLFRNGSTIVVSVKLF